MTARRAMTAALVLGLAGTLGGACRGNDYDRTKVRETDADDRRRAGMLVLGDQEVVDELKAPQVPGRIIYDKPVDLSLANAQRTRPDLVKPDTTGRDTSSAVRRDTTAGDASTDTSGGAARRPRP